MVVKISESNRDVFWCSVVRVVIPNAVYGIDVGSCSPWEVSVATLVVVGNEL